MPTLELRWLFQEPPNETPIRCLRVHGQPTATMTVTRTTGMATSLRLMIVAMTVAICQGLCCQGLSSHGLVMDHSLARRGRTSGRWCGEIRMMAGLSRAGPSTKRSATTARGATGSMGGSGGSIFVSTPPSVADTSGDTAERYFARAARNRFQWMDASNTCQSTQCPFWCPTDAPGLHELRTG